MNKIPHTKGIGQNCYEEDENCIWDAENGEFVTREYYEKVMRLREQHENWYKRSYQKELNLIKITSEHDTRLAQKQLDSMPATDIKKEI